MTIMPRLNLSLKFFLSTTILGLLVVSFLIVDSHYSQMAVIEGKMQRKAVVMAEALSMVGANAFLVHDYSTLRRFATIVVKDADVVSVAFVDAAGIVKMHNDIDMIGQRVPILPLENDGAREGAEAPLDPRQKIFLFSEPIEVGDRRLGFVQIQISNQRLVQDLAASRNRLLMIGLIAIVAAGLGAIFMARMISRPLRRLAEGAKRISQGDLHWSVAVKTGDEIEVLADAFAYMTRNLKRYIDSLVVKERKVVLGELAAGIAHEVRNPLEPIKGSAEILQKKYGDDPAVIKYTRIIKEEIDGVCKFLDQFLQLTKLPEPTEEPLDVHGLLEETVAFLGYHLSEHRMQVVKAFEAPTADVFADPQQLKQVFINLILNAVQARRPEARQGRIQITTMLEPGEAGAAPGDTASGQAHLVVTIVDDGIGIPPADVARIFDPFFTTKAEGTGLGLAICQTILDRHHGGIEAQSQPGAWTRMRVRLPLLSAAAARGTL